MDSVRGRKGCERRDGEVGGGMRKRRWGSKEWGKVINLLNLDYRKELRSGKALGSVAGRCGGKLLLSLDCLFGLGEFGVFGPYLVARLNPR